jgi:GH43 family beta-xylosidase
MFNQLLYVVLATCACTLAHAQGDSMIVNPVIKQRADPHEATWPCISGRRKSISSTASGTSTSPPVAVTTSGRFGFTCSRTRALIQRRAWIERGQLKTEFESFSLDATTFVHRGQRYLVWTQRPAQPKGAGTDIYIARMRGPLHVESPYVSISSPTLEWEVRGHKVNEAPAVLVRNGRVFITFSASATGADYCMGLLTADADANLLDRKSWTKSPAPVFSSNEAMSQYGPGHNSFTVAEDGKTDVFVYHARQYEEIVGDPLYDPNRNTRIQPLWWDDEGMSKFGKPVADGPLELTAEP